MINDTEPMITDDERKGCLVMATLAVFAAIIFACGMMVGYIVGAFH